MGKFKNYTGFLRERFSIDPSSTEEKKIKDFINAHKLPKSFYIELRLREMDKRMIQTKNLEETLNMMTKTRSLIVEWNLALHLRPIVTTLKIFTKSTGARSYVVDPYNKTHLCIILYIGGQMLQRPLGEAFKISDCLCLATVAAARKEIMLSAYLKDDRRFPLGNGWSQIDEIIGLALPILKSNGQVIAVVELSKTIYSYDYSPIDIEAVSLLSSLFGYLAEESEIVTELQMLLTFINPMMKLITQYLECTLPVASIVSQLTLMNKNELGAINSSFCVKKDIRNQQYNITYTEDTNTSHCHVETSKIYSRDDSSFLGRSMIIGEAIKGKEIDGQQWFLGIPIKFNEVTGGMQFQFLCMQEPNISENNEKLLEITCTFLAFILEMNELGDALFRHEREIVVIEDMLKLQTCNCSHELHELQIPPVLHSIPTEIYLYPWSPEITSDDKTNLLLFRNIVETGVGHVFFNKKSLNEFALFIKRTHFQNKEISFRHILITAHFMVTFLKNNGDYFSQIERDALVMSALCHHIHKCEPIYSFIYASLFKTFRISESSSKATGELLNKMRRWKYFYPCNYSSDCGRSKKKYRDLLNLISKKKFNNRNKCHRELIIIALIINADKCMYYKNKVFMSHHDEYCYDRNIEFSLHMKDKNFPQPEDKQLWAPRILDKSATNEYQQKKQIAINLTTLFLQPWLNILQVFFPDTECLQGYLNNSIKILMQQEKEIKREQQKTFMFMLQPIGLWHIAGPDLTNSLDRDEAGNVYQPMKMTEKIN